MATVAGGRIVIPFRNNPAFQSGSFQTNAFQTIQHSVDAFQKCAFSHEGFQTSICEDSARSGYWRLFYTQLQEESLKKDTESSSQEKPVAAPVVPVAQQKQQKSKPIQPRSAAPSIKPQHVTPTFKLRPVDNTPTPLETALNHVWLLSAEFRHIMFLEIPGLEQVLIQQQKIKEAANDADIRLRLLLLSA